MKLFQSFFFFFLFSFSLCRQFTLKSKQKPPQKSVKYLLTSPTSFFVSSFFLLFFFFFSNLSELGLWEFSLASPVVL